MKQQSNPWISISNLLSSVVLILLLLFIMASIVPKFSMDSQRLEMMNQINLALKEYEKEGLVKVHRESGVLEFTSVTFDQGSAQLNSNTEHLVEEMSKKLQVYLKEKPNLEILIEGHTDPSAVHNVVNIGGYYDSNIQLSALRAINVRNTLLRHVGAEYSGRIGVAGYGETRLKNKDNPMASENRRVEIRLLWSNTDNK